MIESLPSLGNHFRVRHHSRFGILDSEQAVHLGGSGVNCEAVSPIGISCDDAERGLENVTPGVGGLSQLRLHLLHERPHDQDDGGAAQAQHKVSNHNTVISFEIFCTILRLTKMP